MTEHSKFPLLPAEGDEAADDSSIMRAVKSFDWRKMMPPPVPLDLPESTPRQLEMARKPGIGEIGDGLAALSPTDEPQTPSQPVADPQAAAAPERRPQSATFSTITHPVDRKQLREQGMIVPEGQVTGLLEEFRIIKRHVLLRAAELRELDRQSHKAQRVLICSPLPGEGKTYCAVNLALSIAAEKESDVLLVDADFGKPSVLATLGLPPSPGLMDALADPRIDVADLVLRTDIPGLWVLPAGNATNSDSEYLSSSRTADVLARLTEGAPHRIVIFDSPPALAASPAAELAKYVGQALVVARADRTGQGALEDAISLLSACPDIQLLLNAANYSPSGRRFGSYYGYKG